MLQKVEDNAKLVRENIAKEIPNMKQELGKDRPYATRWP
jgi:hypothetical protein